MELLKRNIHMNRQKNRAVIQITLDDDFNVSDSKPDIDKIIREDSDIRLEETVRVQDGIMVNGNFRFNILYLSESEGKLVHNMTGNIPFEETIHMENVEDNDTVKIKWEVEDLTASLINSRKLNIKAIITLTAIVEELYDEETATGVDGEGVETDTKSLNITQIAINKKDTWRLKEDITIAANKPNIYELLWDSAAIRNVDVRLLDDKINLKGEVVLFVLYTGEEDESPIQYIENVLPFNTMIDCNGCREEMISSIGLKLLQKELEVKPDYDGEERVISVDIVIELDIKAYEEEEIQILKDVYSVSKELVPVMDDAHYENLLIKNLSRCRLSDRVKLKNVQDRILQICYSEGVVTIDEARVVENGIETEGVVSMQFLYIAGDDKRPLNSMKAVIPFQHTIEVKGIDENCSYEITPTLEEINTMMLDSEEIEVKTAISMDVIVFRNVKEPIIIDVKEEELDEEKLQEMPGIVGYIVKEEDSLWKIAKRFYTTMDMIREMNDMEEDAEIKAGDRLLIIKKVDEIA